MSSISYYDKNAQDFYERTINADVQDLYQKFLKYVPKQGRILDAGCGVGRDSKFFLSKGYEVVAFDGSLEYENLRKVIEDFHKTLLPSGILYASFKYGTLMREVEDRFFFDMNEASIEPYLQGLFNPLEIWKSADTRSKVAPSPDKSWLNFIARRVV